MQWMELVNGALSQLDESSAGDFAQLLNRYGRFYAPVASLENALTATRTAEASVTKRLLRSGTSDCNTDDKGETPFFGGI